MAKSKWDKVIDMAKTVVAYNGDSEAGSDRVVEWDGKRLEVWSADRTRSFGEVSALNVAAMLTKWGFTTDLDDNELAEILGTPHYNLRQIRRK